MFIENSNNKAMNDNKPDTEKEKSRCTLDDIELVKESYKIISQMCEKGKWQMSVPVDFNRDSDMLLVEVCNRFEKANAKIAELEKENESLKYWKAERDEEAEAERVSIAVAEIEIEKQEVTKEEQKEWFNAGGMAERIIWKDEIEKLESEIKKLREERDEFAIKFLEFSLTRLYRADSHPSILIEQFKQQSK